MRRWWLSCCVWSSACVPVAELESGSAKVTNGSIDQLSAAVGMVGSGADDSMVGCTATLVAPRIVVTAKSCLPAGVPANAVRFVWGPNLASQEGRIAVQQAFWDGALGTASQRPDEYQNLLVLVLESDPGVVPIPARAVAPRVGETIQAVGYGHTSRTAAENWDMLDLLRRSAPSSIWAVHQNDPIFVTTTRAGGGTHCGPVDVGGPAIADGQVAGIFGWPADPAQRCSIGGRYYRLDLPAARRLIDRGIAYAAEHPAVAPPQLQPPPPQQQQPETPARWTCAPSQGYQFPAQDQSDGYCDCGCGVLDDACGGDGSTGCAARGCSAPGCRYCADPDGRLEDCTTTPAPDEPPAPQVQPLVPGADEGCFDRLRARGVSFTPTPIVAEASRDPNSSGLVCDVPDAVTLGRRFPNGMRYTGASITLACWYAEELVTFTDELRQLGVTSFESWGGYACRYTSDGNWSYHADGLAVDVPSVNVGRRQYVVSRSWNDQSGLLREISSMARDATLTVYDPNWNAAHWNHIHLEDTTSSL